MFFNLIGFALFIVAGAMAEGFVRVLGSTNRDLQVLFAGASLAMLDVMVRSWRGVRPFGRGGGVIMFLPAWVLGLAFVVGCFISLLRSA